MSQETFEVALIGFTPSESSTFETFFRLVSSRRAKPLRTGSTLSNAQLVLFNATSGYAIEEVANQLKANQLLVTVGFSRSERSWRHLDRPINLNAVLMTIDAAIAVLVASQPAASAAVNTSPERMVSKPVAPSAPVVMPSPIVAASPTVASPMVSVPKPVAPPTQQPMPPAREQQRTAQPAASSINVQTVMIGDRAVPTVSVPPQQRVAAPTVAPMPPVVPKVIPTPPTSNVAPFPSNPRVAQAPQSARAQPTETKAPTPAPSTTPAGRTNILVVDDSDVALKFIHSRLSAFGFNVDLCTSGEEALVRVSDGGYAFVFLDVMMEGLDGYQTCKAIKGRKYAGSRAPVVVMLTSRGGTIDKVRGTFAGCDAYLTKPLDESKMLKVLLKHNSELSDSISTLSTPTISAPLPRVDTTKKTNPLAAAYESLANRSP
ncbi:MAG: response regulator [Casimicrobium sp.]